MVLKLYNTYSHKIEEFHPLEKGKIKMYSCGPDVYAAPHIGNMAYFVMTDVLKKYLKFLGFEVRHIMNRTDFGHLTQDSEFGEDKMYQAMKKLKKTRQEVADLFSEKLFENFKKLNIEPASKYPLASVHIKEMIEMVETLLEKGFAYEKNGNVFFNVDKFKNYGKLSGNTLEALKEEARLEPHEDKKKPYDFALWLKSPEGYPIIWDSPWGKGTPGWHIECSAMSREYLGDTFDIHTGGEDNIFPHHENEIAQSESATGKKFVNYWVHRRHLLVDGKKMSKSLGNFYTVQDLEKKGIEPLVFRYFLLTSHYRTKINYTEKAIEDAKKALVALVNFYHNLSEAKANKDNPEIEKLIAKSKKAFNNAMSDDLNTPKALGIVHELTRNVNNIGLGNISKNDAEKIKNLLQKIDAVFAILGYKPTLKLSREKIKEIENLIDERNKARAQKNWIKADKIRDNLLNLGIAVKDEGDETKWDVK